MIENCPMRHENGNCIPAGGFCTANKNICEALLNAYRMGKAQLSQEGTTSDLISRQAAIEKFAMTAPQMSVIRIYEAVEILESMPTIQPVATGTTSDLISRQAAIYALHMHLMYRMGTDSNKKRLDDWINNLPSAQPELSHTQKSCEYCHEDSDGYTRPIEKNCHAYIRFGMNGWELDLKAKGWHGEAQIKFCPMCGRELQGGR